MLGDFQVIGQNPSAPFTLKIHRGDGMSLLAMNWKVGKPPENLVGFSIEYSEPSGSKFYSLKNRLSFPDADKDDPNTFSTLRSPIQKFRWVHFPRNAEIPGQFTYKVKPVFMNEGGELSFGEPQTAKLELQRETYPDKLNIAYTRGFVSSQAFVDKYTDVKGILPAKAAGSLDFVPTNSKAPEAMLWMGFEARRAILDVLDKALSDTTAEVRVVAYDLNEPEVVSRLEKLKTRLKIIIDNSGDHKPANSEESKAADRLAASAGAANVKRQHMASLQHNKFIAVKGTTTHIAVCGSTNFSWRAFFVQNNNAIVVQGDSAIRLFLDAFDNYWDNDSVAGFGKKGPVEWESLGLSGINVKIAFSPHTAKTALLKSVADDVKATTSSLFYSLAFLYQTPGVIKNAIVEVTKDKERFVYGISDREVGGITLQKPDGNLAPVYPAALSKDLPAPFKKEPVGGGGIRMHHKFLVIDFDKPTARVYVGSYNFSVPADTKNGENLLVIRDRRIAVSYLVEALSMFDHYHFRVSQMEAKTKRKKLELVLPPKEADEEAWWEEYYSDPQKIRDRELFA